MANPREKFSKIYDKYINKIYRFVFLKVSSQEIAEDLTSEVFLKTWRFFKEKGQEIENIQAFLYKTARNLVTDHYRQKGRIRIVSINNPLIIDPRQDLERDSKINSDIDVIRIVMSDLKDDYQNVLIMHYLDDLSIDEISGLLGRSNGATRVLVHRALKSLRKALKDKVEEV